MQRVSGAVPLSQAAAVFPHVLPEVCGEGGRHQTVLPLPHLSYRHRHAARGSCPLTGECTSIEQVSADRLQQQRTKEAQIDQQKIEQTSKRENAIKVMDKEVVRMAV